MQIYNYSDSRNAENEGQIYEKSSEVIGAFLRCGRKMNLICNHLVLNILCSPIPSVQHIIQSLDFTVLRCVTAGVPFDANIAKIRYAKSKCSHKLIVLRDVSALQMRPRLFYFLFTEFSISEAISVLKNCSICTASTSYLGFNC